MEALGAPYDTATPEPFDYGTPFVSLLTQTRAALRAQQPHATASPPPPPAAGRRATAPRTPRLRA